MPHLVRSVVESLHAAGRCPRIHANSLCEGVICPDFIREQWRERLIIDLDPGYPLDLEFDDDGLSADLSFGGYVTRCVFPFAAIYVVADRSTGRGVVLEQNMPAAIQQNREAEAPENKTKRPKLRSVTNLSLQEDAPDDEDAALESDSTPAEPKKNTQPHEAAVAEAFLNADANEEMSPTDQAAEEVARKRRAAFRVIEGGG